MYDKIITLNKGGSAETQKPLYEVNIPDMWHDAVYLRTLAKHAPTREGRIYLNQIADRVLETWHLANDLKRHIGEAEAGSEFKDLYLASFTNHEGEGEFTQDMFIKAPSLAGAQYVARQTAQEWWEGGMGEPEGDNHFNREDYGAWVEVDNVRQINSLSDIFNVIGAINFGENPINKPG